MDITEIYRRYPAKVDCIKRLEQVRWNGKPICPYCKSDRTTPLPKEYRHHCNSCFTTFSVTVNTVFHHTHLPLQKWFLALSIIFNAKKITARQLARDLEVNKNSAWLLIMRVREAMTQPAQRELLQKIITINDNYEGLDLTIGGNLYLQIGS